VSDGATSSVWNFGNSTNFQYRASIEKVLSSGTFGVAASYASVPFSYESSGGAVLLPRETGAQCLGQCDAHVRMTSLVAIFHAGTGIGFHQVIELSGGAVAYQNLTRDSDGAKLAPAGGNIDPLFAFGYGLGYGLNDRTAIEFVPDYAIAIHERNGLPNGQSNTNSMRSLRLSLRMGFGARTVTR
jgi:hypothetical protein